MSATRRGWVDDAGVGCLTTILTVAFVVVGFITLLEVSSTAASLWLLGCLAIGTWRSEVRRRERRQAEAARRAARRRSRGYGGVIDHLRARTHAGQPIDATGPLPRQWSAPVRRGHAAVEDYRAGTAALPEGPVRTRLAEGLRGMERGAEQLEEVARRGAELERQLIRFRKDLRRLPPGAGEEERARAERLAGSVATARAHVDERLASLCSAALEVADAAVTLSLTDADRVVDDVEDAFSSAYGVAAAVEEVRSAERAQRARGARVRSDRRPSSDRAKRLRPSPPRASGAVPVRADDEATVDQPDPHAPGRTSPG